MTGLPPFRLEAAPLRPHCTCMSGLTEAQLKLMNLHGALQVVEWLTVEAQHSVIGPAPMGNPALHELLLKLQHLLLRAQGLCLNSAFPQVAP